MSRETLKMFLSQNILLDMLVDIVGDGTWFQVSTTRILLYSTVYLFMIISEVVFSLWFDFLTEYPNFNLKLVVNTEKMVFENWESCPKMLQQNIFQNFLEKAFATKYFS